MKTKIKEIYKKALVVTEDFEDQVSQVLEITTSGGTRTVVLSKEGVIKDLEYCWGADVELVRGWKRSKKTIQKARNKIIMRKTDRTNKYLEELSRLDRKLAQFNVLIKNSEFMPSLKKKILKEYFNKNVEGWEYFLNESVHPPYGLINKVMNRKSEVRSELKKIKEAFPTAMTNFSIKRISSLAACLAGAAIGSALPITALRKTLNRINSPSKTFIKKK